MLAFLAISAFSPGLFLLLILLQLKGLHKVVKEMSVLCLLAF
jgi:hypothetical protein